MYGIKNCDTVRKAMAWLSERVIDCEFHDLKKDVIDVATIDHWLNDVERDTLINRRSQTWRKIPTEDKLLNTREAIVKIILENPTVLKRPVIYNGQFWSVGFSEQAWDKLFL
jgi:arsenate reductase